ncbi:MAG TPA: hypothetical protein PK286_09130 [Devosia sp.]|nr:hypothetical protein [Devosia sp.]
MTNNVLFVLTAPFDGQDQDYNAWYTDKHLGDVVVIPGVESAQRFTPTSSAAEPRYLALYNISDPLLALAGLRERSGTERMPMTPALDTSKTQTMMLTEIGSGAAASAADLPLEAGDLVAFAWDRQASAGGRYRVFVPNEAQLRPSVMPSRVLVVSGIEGGAPATGGAKFISYSAITGQVPKPAAV